MSKVLFILASMSVLFCSCAQNDQSMNKGTSSKCMKDGKCNGSSCDMPCKCPQSCSCK